MIALFTDFGWSGPYVGQMHAVLARAAPAAPVIDIMHDAPRFDAVAAGHVLAALVPFMPAGTIWVAVIDPGVGTARRPLVLEADGQWLVGPDNGLFETVAARARASRRWHITRAPATPAATFHGRDLFAPVAAELALGGGVPGDELDQQTDATGACDRAAVIYIDGFGNAMTGLRGTGINPGASLGVAGRVIPGGRTFADAAPGDPLWFVDSLGLVEIAVNQGSAAAALDLAIGSPVHWEAHDAGDG